MSKIIFIMISLLSTSVFATELDQPVTNVSDRSRLEKKLPPTVIIRRNEKTGVSEFLISEDKIAAHDEEAMKQIASTAKFTPIASQDQVQELDREGGVASFYFQYNFGFYNPYVRYYYPYAYARTYTYNYAYGAYYSWYWSGYTYNCFRLGWY
ncbi:MAG: hypothetical protein KDD37_07795 [Bdellovibrionales bacterium]|nr:hypothetical protein [Bdellovibrionales bacterium]